ncbi:hypothetical protein FKP32DRAFT_1595433 [Trametes sanguinea]|nr:hypothetical protein FKP32DRAFT_1595433 [Trametes sanguinea]
MSGAAWNIYAEQLEGLRYGYPLWVPDPAPQMQPVELGDVGWVREGEFIPIFNAFRSAQDAQPWDATPQGFAPLSRRGLSFIGPREKIGQTLLCSNSIKKREGSTNLGAGGPANLPSGNIGFSFLCRDDAGAILSFHPAAMSHEVLAEGTIKNYISANFDSWYKFATEERGFPLREQDLRFVIGTTKSIRWAVAAFRGRYRNKKGALTGMLGAIPGTANMSFTISDQSLPSTHWRIGPPTRTNPQPTHPERLRIEGSQGELPESYDQCLFVHSVKAKRRLLPRFLKAGAGPHELPRQDGDPPSEQVLSAVDGDSEYETDRDSEDSSDADSVLPDPVDVLLDYILENSDAQMAIASDVDLYTILKELPGWPEDLKSALSTLSPKIILTDDGVGSVHAPGQADKPSKLGKVTDESVLASTSTSARVSAEQRNPEYEAIKQRVSAALVAVLGKAEQVIEQFPEVDTVEDIEESAPIPPLSEAAETLLQVWAAANAARTFHHACLRMADFCAIILKAVRDEVVDAGEEASLELQSPIARLTEAFRHTYTAVTKQSSGTFISRYLRRSATRQALLSCSDTLKDVLSTFNFSLALRVQRQLNYDAAAQDISLESGPLSSDVVSWKNSHAISLAGSILGSQVNAALALDDLDHEDRLIEAIQVADGDESQDLTSILGVEQDEIPEALTELRGAMETGFGEGAEDESLDDLHSAEKAPGPASITATNTGKGAPLESASDVSTREFLQASIDALSRVSITAEPDGLPEWTIARYDIDLGELIGVSAWTKVYKGTWKGRAVAIKTYAEVTPKHIFEQQMATQRALHHPHVLELLGASSGHSDPPWHTVHPYYKNGSLVEHLHRLPKDEPVDVLRMILEIAKGMAYLHSQDILHGDLKAQNILVDDEGHCVIHNFGQSDMKAEIYRISGITHIPESIRWQAPELMSGESGLTPECDVYAFAITCVEISTRGALPWPMADDETVRNMVLRDDKRPALANHHLWSSRLATIVSNCWARAPAQRPSFAQIETDLGKLHDIFDANAEGSRAQDTDATLSKYFATVLAKSPGPAAEPLAALNNAHLPDLPKLTKPHYSYLQDSHMSKLSDHITSPLPLAEHARDLENERRYRTSLVHEFNPSLTLPLWTPSKVSVGAVGYHSPSRGGQFVVLFDSLNPSESSGGRAKDIPSLPSYRHINQNMDRQDRRSVVQRGLDMVASWTGASRRQGGAPYARRYTERLRAGHVAARLFTESTVYRYIEDLTAPKMWLKASIDQILALYKEEHDIAKEDVCLVVGTLEAEQYATLVSHEHRDGRAHFNVFRSPQEGQPWGEFTFEVDEPSTSIHERPKPSHYAEKVSKYSRERTWDSVLLARLRFKPDAAEPTVL